MATITSKNPFNNVVNGTFETLTNDELTSIINQADSAYSSWKNTTFEERKKLFLRLADLIDEEHENLARLETIEMGRLFSVSKKGLPRTANLIRWYANNAKKILGDESFSHDGLTGKIKHDSLGVVFGIAPRNFPFNQVLRAACANIIAGNTTVYKHASNVPMCGKAIEDLFINAGFPIGVYTNIYAQGSQSEHIISNKKIKGVNLTGGELAGSAVGSLAGKYLKPSVLELGGNDAFVLIDHKNTESMASLAVSCRISNGGQRCNASKRFIILDKHYDEFVEFMGKYMSAQILGDPMDPTTQIPPLAKKSLVNEVHDQVQRTIADGATLITGGKILGDDGQFYAPTVLADVTPEMASFKEEVFGPVATVIRSSSVEESIALANGSDYGLSAVVFGDDVEQCKEVADQLDGGMIFINNPAGSKASLPFGGVKKSGYGKENGAEGLKAFTNKKAIIYSID